MNSIQPNIKFTVEIENKNSLNFLDLTIQKYKNQFKYKITGNLQLLTTIHADSFHPYTQKTAAYNALIHRLLTIPLEPQDFQDELNTI